MDKHSKIITDNMYEFLMQFSNIDGGYSENLDDYMLIYAGVPRLNCVVRLKNNSNQNNNIIEKLKSIKYPFILILEENSDYSDIEKLLINDKFVLRDIINGQLLDLKNYHIHELDDKNILIKEVASNNELDNWLKIVTNIYNINKEDRPRFQDIIHQISDFNNGKMKFYIAYHNLQPVTTAAVFYGTNSAGIYWVATKEEKRCKGFATYLMQYILNTLTQSKYKYIVLQSSDMACSLYKKINFKEFINYKIYSYNN